MIRNSDEQSIISSLLAQSPHEVWIGLNDIKSEGTYVWGVNQASVRYNAYRNGEPNNVNGNEDTCIRSDGWSDYRALEHLPICASS